MLLELANIRHIYLLKDRRENMPTIFYSTSELLTGLLESIKNGKTQLPDFQRGWVWDEALVLFRY